MAGAMLLRAEDYEAGLTRDETGGQIPSAAREVYEVMCVTQGGAEYCIEDQYYRLCEGDILVVPVGAMVGATLKRRGCPFQRYGLWMSRRYMSFLKLQDDAADFVFRLALAARRYLVRLPRPQFDEMAEAFGSLAKECEGEGLNAELSAKASLAALLVRVNRAVKEGEQTVLLAGDSSRLSPVLTHIHGHCTDALAVESLAEQFGYSPSHLAHSFKKQMGISLYHYVLLRRLQIGREAMLDRVPVKEAYRKCGFGDYAGFYRAFVKEFGLSPQQYKKRNA